MIIAIPIMMIMIIFVKTTILTTISTIVMIITITVIIKASLHSYITRVNVESSLTLMITLERFSLTTLPSASFICGKDSS